LFAFRADTAPIIIVKCTKPGDFFPGDLAIFEVAEHVHLTEDTVLVKQQFLVVFITALQVVIVFIIALSQLTATRRQQPLRLNTTSTIIRRYDKTIRIYYGHGKIVRTSSRNNSLIQLLRALTLYQSLHVNFFLFVIAKWRHYWQPIR